MNVTIEKIVYPGKSLGGAGGKLCLTDEGLPGEVVEVRPLKEKSNYVEARTLRIIRASEKRIAPRCSHYKVCSSYQIMPYAFQLEIKEAQIREILGGHLRQAEIPLEVAPSPRAWHYRNKVRLRILWKQGTARLAYHVPGRQSEFAEIEECFLVGDSANLLLADLLDELNAHPLASLDEVEVRESRAGSELLLSFFPKETPKPGLADTLIRGLASRHRLAGIVFLEETKTGLEQMTAWGKDFIEEKLGATRFQIGPKSFFQVNVDLLPRVIQDIIDTAGLTREHQLADFYCGLGTFGISLAPKIKKVFGIESSADNIEFLKRNLVANGVENFTICEGRSEDWLSWVLARGVDTVLFDPPRKGLSPDIVCGLAAKPVDKLIYLSCNPATLARDLTGLAGAYKIRGLRVYDFFPQTPHIETLAILERK